MAGTGTFVVLTSQRFGALQLARRTTTVTTFTFAWMFATVPHQGTFGLAQVFLVALDGLVTDTATTSFVCHLSTLTRQAKKGKMGAYTMNRVAAGAHLPTAWFFVPAKRPDNRADYCLDCSCLP